MPRDWRWNRSFWCSVVLDYREEETAAITQESVRLRESLCGECAEKLSAHWRSQHQPDLDVCFSQEIDAAQPDLREPGGLWGRSLQGRIVSDCVSGILIWWEPPPPRKWQFCQRSQPEKDRNVILSLALSTGRLVPLLLHQWNIGAGPLRGWPPDKQPEAPGRGEEDEAGVGRHGGQQPEAGRGERRAAAQGQSVRRVWPQRACQRAGGPTAHACVHVPPQKPAAGSEGKDAEGGGGGDEGHAELHRGRQSPRLRTQQTRGQSESTAVIPESCFCSSRHVHRKRCIWIDRSRKETLSVLLLFVPTGGRRVSEAFLFVVVAISGEREPESDCQDRFSSGRGN